MPISVDYEFLDRKAGEYLVGLGLDITKMIPITNWINLGESKDKAKDLAFLVGVMRTLFKNPKRMAFLVSCSDYYAVFGNIPSGYIRKGVPPRGISRDIFF